MIYSKFIKQKTNLHYDIKKLIKKSDSKGVAFKDAINLYFKYRITTTYKKRYEENPHNNSLVLIKDSFIKAFDNKFKGKTVTLDKYNRVILDSDFIYLLMKINIFRKKTMHASKFIDDLKRYKIISKFSQSIKKCRKSDPNSPHDHFIFEDFQYYDQILDQRDAVINQLKSLSKEIKENKDFDKRNNYQNSFNRNLSIFFALYLFQNYDKKVIKNISIEYLYELDSSTIVWIGTLPIRKNKDIKDERVYIQFFDSLISELLKDLFFDITENTTLFDINYKYTINNTQINEYILIQYSNIVSEMIESGGYSKDKAIGNIKQIIKTTVAMEKEIHSDAFSVTLAKQVHYPQISLHELLDFFPHLKKEKSIKNLLELENENIKKQKKIPESEDDEEDTVENFNEIDFIETNLNDYEALSKFKSFHKIHILNNNIKKQKNEYNKYLLNFSKFKYGDLLGTLLCNIEQGNQVNEKFETRNQLIKHINDSIQQSINKKIDSTNEVSRFYHIVINELLSKTSVNNIYINLIKSTDEFKIASNSQKFNDFEKNLKDQVPYFELKTLPIIIDYIEKLILECKLNRKYKGTYSTKTVLNFLNILFNYCFDVIIKKDFLALIVADEIESKIEKFKDKNTYNIYKNQINRFLSQFGYKIGTSATLKKFTNKALITKKDLDMLYKHSQNQKIGFSHKRMKPFIFFLILYYTGARKRELLNALAKDIFLVDNTIYLTIKKGKTESAKRRVSSLKVDQKYFELLSDYVEYLDKNKCVYLFPKDLTKPHSKEDTKFIDKELSEMLYTVINAKYVTMHSFRHTYYTAKLIDIIYQNPINKYVGQFYDLVNEQGHSSPQIGLTYYAHLDYIILSKNRSIF